MFKRYLTSIALLIFIEVLVFYYYDGNPLMVMVAEFAYLYPIKIALKFKDDAILCISVLLMCATILYYTLSL